jgi:uncharacterized protein (DUF1800 family)
MALTPYTGPWGLRQAAHLLRRATCGVTKSQIDTFAGLNVNTAVDALFPNTAPPDPILPIDPQTGQEWFLSGITDANSENADLIRYFHGWFIGQMLCNGVSAGDAPAYSAREKMVWFLHTHFTAITSKISNSRSLYFQNQLFRLYTRDGFSSAPYMNLKELTVKVSVDNAMLMLLDGGLNVKGAPNENYARELLELYSIGRGIEGNIPEDVGGGDYYYFTEQDVQEAAKVLSGWALDDDFATFDLDTGLPRGKVKGSPTNASGHDNDPKTFSNRFGGQVIEPDPTLPSPTEDSALGEIRQLVDMIYAKRDTVKNICWKIYRFYVWGPHLIDEVNVIAAPDAIIDDMADTMIANGYKIQPVIDELLRSQHFYEENPGTADNNIGALIKSPLDLVFGTLRFFDVQLPNMITQPEEFYAITADITAAFGGQGLNFYEPYDVAGYEAYHQYPVYHRFWITPNFLVNRYDFIKNIIGMPANALNIDTLDFIYTHFNAEAPDPDALIEALSNYLYPKVFDNPATSMLTVRRSDYFKSRFLGAFTAAEWTAYWNGNDGEVPNFLNNLFNAMLQSPEYQLS